MRSERTAAGWQLTETTGPAAALHDRAIPPDPVPEVWIHHVEGPALVLGSTQDDRDLVVTDAGETASSASTASSAVSSAIEVCRRRSGGGLVSLLPGNDLWIDVILPSSSGLSVDDVGLAGAWVGQTWAAALREALPAAVDGEPWPVEVHRGSLRHRAAGRVLCFAGLGPGEVTVGGRKVVGLSQRRTRHAARFQSVMTWSWPGEWLAPQLTDQALERGGLTIAGVRSMPVGLPDEILESTRPSLATVTQAFLDRLPTP
ncbi:MAG: lipoyl protein ligase domain-containing protein [Acidimicrobiales bacterium]